jgi:hypothetical protein
MSVSLALAMDLWQWLAVAAVVAWVVVALRALWRR